jgi:hypothetical protein
MRLEAGVRRCAGSSLRSYNPAAIPYEPAARLSALLVCTLMGGDPVMTHSMRRNARPRNRGPQLRHGRFLLRLCIDVSQKLVRRRLPIRA